MSDNDPAVALLRGIIIDALNDDHAAALITNGHAEYLANIVVQTLVDAGFRSGRRIHNWDDTRKIAALRNVLKYREQELLELKGPCSTCHLHYAHSGPCET